MKSRHILIVVALALTAAGTGRADSVLTGTEHMDVTTSHILGVLLDTSTADVLAGGYIANAYVNDEALLRVMRPSGSAVDTAWAYNSGRIVVSSGDVSYPTGRWNLPTCLYRLSAGIPSPALFGGWATSMARATNRKSTSERRLR